MNDLNLNMELTEILKDTVLVNKYEEMIRRDYPSEDSQRLIFRVYNDISQADSTYNPNPSQKGLLDLALGISTSWDLRDYDSAIAEYKSLYSHPPKNS